VLKPDLYDPKLNRAYAEFAHHYGVLLDPARIAKPKDKARCERIVPYVRESLFTGRDVATLAGWRTEAARWSTEVAGARHCRPLEGAGPLAVFRATEVGPAAPRSSASCSGSTCCTAYGPPRGSWALPAATAQAASRPPAGGRSKPVIPPTAR